MNMDLAQALRLSSPSSFSKISPKSLEIKKTWEPIALVGAGGKTTALFQLASQLAPAVVTTTTHLGTWQAEKADRHFVLNGRHSVRIESQFSSGVTLVTGPVKGDRLTGLDKTSMNWLRTTCSRCDLPLLIEADGAKGRPIKAPAEYEPVIPEFVKLVLVIAGLSGLDKPLINEFVHRPEIFARLSKLKMGEMITPEGLTHVLTHPAGGLKGIPAGVRRVVLLNQADTPELLAQGKMITEGLLTHYSAVIIASVQQGHIHAVCEPVAGVILAAGESKRFGSPKQLLDWHGKPFIRQVAETALAAGLSPVIVVTGANSEAMDPVVHDLPLKIIHNPAWQTGQGSSIRAGMAAEGLREVGSAIFLLADQPQVSTSVLRELVELHSSTLNPIIAPQVSGRRTNPVLFDRNTFSDLSSLSGDVGGRAIFSKYPVTYLPWQDENLTLDIDTPEDYRKLIQGE